jgi:hypothetical protein
MSPPAMLMKAFPFEEPLVSPHAAHEESNFYGHNTISTPRSDSAMFAMQLPQWVSESFHSYEEGNTSKSLTLSLTHSPYAVVESTADEFGKRYTAAGAVSNTSSSDLCAYISAGGDSFENAAAAALPHAMTEAELDQHLRNCGMM